MCLSSFLICVFVVMVCSLMYLESRVVMCIGWLMGRCIVLGDGCFR